MTHFALIFPGQGSQSIGMLSHLSEQFPQVQTLFSDASDVLHYDLWQLVQQDAEKLNQTEFTQPALLAADVAIYECWKLSSTNTPQFLAGHSLGEYAALVCASALTFQDAIALVAARGKYMQAAVPNGVGAMAAIVGLDDDVVIQICDAASSIGIVSPANFNSIGQIVIAGESHAIEKAIALAQEKGAKIAKKIPVSVPSHCALMQPAANQMAEELKLVEIKKPLIPVIQNADVAFYEAPEKIRDALIRQLTFPVRWVETIQYMINKDVKKFLECGPGKVLSGLNKRISRDIVTENLG
ncbi:MAG: [acyl-carrier-protein] S-malonyltransferase [Gammaproteobacteria bacterium CG_4_10_14_0_8_um_filter_38_16]|nr:MAG: [acyl-carrier-protein] S-malonyltransferase [Gammaproteobacteria bacterium CG_4_10_14_0_8_um_filter_38_16]PJA03621.1 MAG: [acyl-carrier-protein] S-malonyltransferase [Gammaproteobacteria bacterium CG_4_10_14_0_2_um_filter_38_22]PJB10433.1 MAG: [acyl-carrier-protein] S-malonyltransferase [Gammaproteobacteria bacterium CG_4_9_14_3_um_filter_38_9]